MRIGKRADFGTGHEEAEAEPKFYQSGPSLAEAGLKRSGPVQLEERFAGWLSSGSGYITMMDCSS